MLDAIMEVMSSIVVRLDPKLLENPDADLRYLLPDLLIERSAGLLVDDGYDYLDDGRMLLFLRTASLAAATEVVLHVIRNEELVGNSLSTAVVAVAEADPSTAAADYVVAHPADFDEIFALG